MSSYKKNNRLNLITSILFFLGAVVYYLSESYLIAGLLVVLGIIWLIYYRAGQKPYVVIEDGKMILAQGLTGPKAYELSRLSFPTRGKGYLRLSYHGQEGQEDVTIVLSALSRKDGAALYQELSEILKNNQQDDLSTQV